MYVGTVHSQCIAEVNDRAGQGRAGQGRAGQDRHRARASSGRQGRETASAGQAQAQAEHSTVTHTHRLLKIHSGSSLCATLSEVESECW